MFILKTIYILSLNISAIGIICAVFSAQTKLKKKYTQKQTELMEDYRERHGENKDIGNNIMQFLRIVVMCVCPIVNTLIAIEMLTEWDSFRDDIYSKTELEVFKIWQKTKAELKEDNTSEFL